MHGVTHGFDTRFPCIRERTGTARLLRTPRRSDTSACTLEPTSYILCSQQVTRKRLKQTRKKGGVLRLPRRWKVPKVINWKIDKLINPKSRSVSEIQHKGGERAPYKNSKKTYWFEGIRDVKSTTAAL